MEIKSKINETQLIIESWKKQGLSIGLVPTMGYLHDGHKSLIERAKTENDKVVVSIFVNPIQFNQNEDFSIYPRDLNRDSDICKSAGADLIFAPTVDDMYPSKILAYVDIEELGNELCGAKREGHFRGVCTVVSKLFNITSPERAYFGEKDAQQLAIMKQLVKDLNFKTKIVPCPIIREHDGLAMSSRNANLSIEERKASSVIYRSLKNAEKLMANGERNPDIIKSKITDEISKEPLAEINYIEVVDSVSLKSVDKITKPVLIAAAVYVGKTRLIDNIKFSV